MDLNEVLMFVKVVQAGSFTAASALLGMPKSTVSAKVASLEQRLAVSLLHRTTRRLGLTEEGKDFFHMCEKTLNDLEVAEASLGKAKGQPRGALKIAAPNAFGVHLLPGFLSGFLKKYPDISAEVCLSNAFVDLVGEGFDVAIRSGDLKDSTLVAKRIGTSFFSLYASPDYLQKHGEPKRPQDLTDHQCLSFSAIGDEWKMNALQRRATVNIEGCVKCDDITAVKQLALNGLGIGMITEFVAMEDIEAGRLVPVLPGWHAHTTGIYVVYPSHKYQHPKVKAFVSELSTAMKTVFDPAKLI